MPTKEADEPFRGADETAGTGFVGRGSIIYERWNNLRAYGSVRHNGGGSITCGRWNDLLTHESVRHSGVDPPFIDRLYAFDEVHPVTDGHLIGFGNVDGQGVERAIPDTM